MRLAVGHPLLAPRRARQPAARPPPRAASDPLLDLRDRAPAAPAPRARSRARSLTACSRASICASRRTASASRSASASSCRRRSPRSLERAERAQRDRTRTARRPRAPMTIPMTTSMRAPARLPATSEVIRASLPAGAVRLGEAAATSSRRRSSSCRRSLRAPSRAIAWSVRAVRLVRFGKALAVQGKCRMKQLVILPLLRRLLRNAASTARLDRVLRRNPAARGSAPSRRSSPRRRDDARLRARARARARRAPRSTCSARRRARSRSQRIERVSRARARRACSRPRDSDALVVDEPGPRRRASASARSRRRSPAAASRRRARARKSLRRVRGAAPSASLAPELVRRTPERAAVELEPDRSPARATTSTGTVRQRSAVELDRDAAVPAPRRR